MRYDRARGREIHKCFFIFLLLLVVASSSLIAIGSMKGESNLYTISLHVQLLILEASAKVKFAVQSGLEDSSGRKFEKFTPNKFSGRILYTTIFSNR